MPERFKKEAYTMAFRVALGWSQYEGQYSFSKTARGEVRGAAPKGTVMSYSPTLGRWMQQDPSGYVDSMDLYEALSSSPADLLDPMGLQAGASTTQAATQPTTIPTTGPAVPRPPANDSRRERERWAREMADYINGYRDERCPPKQRECLLDGPTLAAQFAFENSWGRNKFAQETNNWGNIKGKGPAGSVKRKVPEYDKNGKRYYEDADFRNYNNLDQFLQDYLDLIQKKYPGACGKVGKEYFEELKKGGYATDPTYVDTATQIFWQVGG